MRVMAMDPIAVVADEIHDLATLLGIVLAGGDADTVLEGMQLVVHEIREKAGMLQKACAGT